MFRLEIVLVCHEISVRHEAIPCLHLQQDLQGCPVPAERQGGEEEEVRHQEPGVL